MDEKITKKDVITFLDRQTKAESSQEEDNYQYQESDYVSPAVGAKLWSDEEALEDWSVNVKNLCMAMKCLGCGSIPSPQFRFLCPRGHHFCQDCGRSRMEACGGNVEPTRDESNDTMNDVMDSKCLGKLLRYPADPVFATLWNNSIWMCPSENDGDNVCEDLVKGYDLYYHLSEGSCKASMEGGV